MSARQLRPPSAAQISYVRSITRDLGIEGPEQCTSDAYRKWLSEWIPVHKRISDKVDKTIRKGAYGLIG